MIDISEYTINTNNYTSKIRDSIFIQGNENTILTKGKEDICEIIIGENVKGLLTKKTETGELYIDIIVAEFEKLDYKVICQKSGL